MNFKTVKVLGVAAALCALVSIGSAAPVRIVALGDSLSAGYGLGPGESFPEQLQETLRERGHDVTVANAGVSGDTASDGLARLEWSVPADADIVIVELGANDALRGVDPAITREALSSILYKLTGRRQLVLLAGMLAPRNMGDAYASAFDAIYPDLAKQFGVPLYPFFLEGVVGNRRLNLPDGIHPTAEGIARIVQSITPAVEELIAARATSD
jgi:acyl-CoA thioesterase-1